MNNLDLYNKVRNVPADAQKSIGGGRLKGMTDINPMWRLKALTENFGMCGFGWKYEIISERLEKGSNDEISAFVKINLFVKVDGVWSEPIPGTGGSSFVTKEKNGLYVSDECFKMALTDAISVACKALGFGADIYWKDKTKYDKEPQPQQLTLVTTEQRKEMFEKCNKDEEKLKSVLKRYGYENSKVVETKDFQNIIKDLSA